MHCTASPGILWSGLNPSSVFLKRTLAHIGWLAEISRKLMTIWIAHWFGSDLTSKKSERGKLYVRRIYIDSHILPDVLDRTPSYSTFRYVPMICANIGKSTTLLCFYNPQITPTNQFTLSIFLNKFTHLGLWHHPQCPFRCMFSKKTCRLISKNMIFFLQNLLPTEISQQHGVSALK